MKSILVVVLASVILFSCNNSSKEDEKLLVGEWQEINEGEKFEDYHLILKENGDFELSYMTQDGIASYSGKWEIDDGSISLLDNDILIKYKAYEIENDILTWGVGGATADIKKFEKI